MGRVPPWDPAFAVSDARTAEATVLALPRPQHRLV